MCVCKHVIRSAFVTSIHLEAFSVISRTWHWQVNTSLAKSGCFILYQSPLSSAVLLSVVSITFGDLQPGSR